jgi:Polyketide cyclase / dehydrase and lipid transport
MFRKILIGLAVVIGIFAVIVALQPSEFRIKRTATIAAPQADVFAQVNDLHKWDAWSPWAKLDPDAKVSFEGADAGQGAIMNWAGNDKVGEGTMTIVESRPNDLIKIKADFVEPIAGTSMSEFEFKPEGDQTSVTWTMSSRHGFLGKAFCLIVNGKKMIGDDLEKGLAQMKMMAEGAKASNN